MTPPDSVQKKRDERRLSAIRWLAKRALRLSVRFQEIYVSLAIRSVREDALRLISELEDKEDFNGLLSLYPDLQRILYIHIPKCGGTAIRRALVQQIRCAPIPEATEQAMKQAIAYMGNTPRLSQPRQLLKQLTGEVESETLPRQYLKVFAGYQLTQTPQKVFFLAHKTARELLPDYRAGKDLLFTTVREPTEILRSLVAYRVFHTIKDCLQPDSMELLNSLNLNIDTFIELAENQPRKLTELILRTNTPPTLAAFLSCDGKTDCDSVWSGIRNHTIFIAHKNEQAQMLEQLFGRQIKNVRDNTSDGRIGLAADFMAAIEDSWITPFLYPGSVKLYQKLESSGIIGFWEMGGTLAEYQDLLRNT